MRFADIRETVFKRTLVAEVASRSVATPLRLSPFKPDGRSVREGVKAGDLLRPLHNRSSRRANGMTRSRRRLAGVALVTKPWQTQEEGVAA